MPLDMKDRFDKIMALAMDPGAHDGEAQAAFAMLRKLVRQYPSLTMPPQPPLPAPSQAPPSPTESNREWRLTKLPSFWLTITVGNLSERAYLLGLRSKFVFDYSEQPTAVDIRCDGPENACRAFDDFLAAIIEWTNTQPADPTMKNFQQSTR